MGGQKTMTPELLPDPTRAARGHDLSPRERVQRHMKDLLKLGAAAGAAVVTSCVYGVVDMLPPPAMCRPLDAGDAFRARAWPEPDHSISVQVTGWEGSAETEFVFGDVSEVQGGTVEPLSLDRRDGRQSITYTLHPDGGASEVRFRVALPCDEATKGEVAHALLVVVHLPPRADAGASDASTDASTGDGGEPAFFLDVEVTPVP